MNGLYGDIAPLSGGYIGVLGADDSDRARPWLMSIIDGSLYTELKEKRLQQKLNNVKVVELQMAIDKMPAGAQKQAAVQQWNELHAKNEEMRRKVEEAATKYDALAGDLRTFSGGAIKPQFLGAIQAAVLVPILVAFAAAILALAGLVVALRADFGVFAKIADAVAKTVEAGGGAIVKTPEAVASWMRTSLYVAAGGLGLYILYRVFSQWEKGKTTFELPRFVKATTAAPLVSITEAAKA